MPTGPQRPSLRQLEYLVAVADAGHFGRAARACHVTQPGLSTQLRQLESLLEVQAFERGGRRVLTTAIGEELVRRARRVLVEVDGLVEAAKGAGRPLSGPLRIGVIPTIAPFVLPKLVPRLHKRHPQLQPLLREDQTERLVEALAAGRLDILLLALEAELGDVVTRPLFEDVFHVVVPVDHRLAGRKSVGERDLEGETVLLLDDGHCLRDQALSICETRGATEIGDFRATSLGTLIEMVASGVGITLLPELALTALTRARRDLAVRPFRRPQPRRTIGLAWRPASARADEYALLAEAVLASR